MNSYDIFRPGGRILDVEVEGLFERRRISRGAV
jgi:hypothetical protein